MIRSVEDLSDDEVTLLYRSLSRIIIAESDDDERDDEIDETRIATLTGRTVKLEDPAAFQQNSWNESSTGR